MFGKRQPIQTNHDSNEFNVLRPYVIDHTQCLTSYQIGIQEFLSWMTEIQLDLPYGQ